MGVQVPRRVHAEVPQGHKFWARGYFVSTVGRDEETIRAYIKNQEIADKQLDQLQLKLASS
jgi:putative transposase